MLCVSVVCMSRILQQKKYIDLYVSSLSKFMHMHMTYCDHSCEQWNSLCSCITSERDLIACSFVLSNTQKPTARVLQVNTCVYVCIRIYVYVYIQLHTHV